MQDEHSEAFLKSLDDLAKNKNIDAQGLYGPNTSTWAICAESVLFVTGLRALLLQVAHPKVAHGVHTFSNHQKDPLGRAYRTFDAVFHILFGSKKEALDTARKVYRIHGFIKGCIKDPIPTDGDPNYVASDPELLLWVYATLSDSLIDGYRRFVGPLSDKQADALYQEGKLFANLFGIPDSQLPADWWAFQRYFQGELKSKRIRVTPEAIAIAEGLLYGGPPAARLLQPLTIPLTSALMPTRLRREFGLPWTIRTRLAYRVAAGSLRTLVPRLPRSLRYHPAALIAKAKNSKSQDYGRRHLMVGEVLRRLMARAASSVPLTLRS